MSLSRKRRRKQEQRRHHGTRCEPRTPSVGGVHERAALAQFSLERLFARRALEAADGAAPREPSPDDDGDVALAQAALAGPELRQALKVERLAYTRRQAAEALGVSISTIDRHIVPSIETIKLPWGQRLIPRAELVRLLHKYRETPRGSPPRRAAGRPPTLPRQVVERVRLEYARGRGLSEIARALTDDGVPTAHGGRRWWASTVRAVLVREASGRLRSKNSTELVSSHPPRCLRRA